MTGDSRRRALAGGGATGVVHGRWEHGSDFHLTLPRGDADAFPWGRGPVTLWGSGRDALRAVIRRGRQHRGWRRLHCPSFYCQDVVRALAREIDVVLYAESPLEPAPALPRPAAHEVLLVVNVYGLRPRPELPGGAVIEDHTHDPWSDWACSSQAEYAVVSLRKTLPLPDGGALWSPRSAPLPEERAMTSAHAQACLDRLSAMALKTRYLEGRRVAKAAFRALAVAGERAVGAGDAPSGVSGYTRAALPALPTARWRRARSGNRAALRAALGDLPGVSVLDTPFAVTLVFHGTGADERRDRARAALADARVYAAVLWPLESAAVGGIPAEHADLARRLLTLQCDFRYTRRDMMVVAERVRRICAAS